MSESANAFTFTYEGLVPSKGNYRYSKSSFKSRQRWKKIKQAESDIGWIARAAGASVRDAPAEVYILVRQQRCDLDSVLKLVLDALRGVAYEDDNPEHLQAIHVARCDKPGPAGLRVTIRYSEEES